MHVMTSCTPPLQPQLHLMGGAGGLKTWDVASVFQPAGKLISDVHESLKAVNSLVEAKRVELRKWDENALGFERALTQEQVLVGEHNLTMNLNQPSNQTVRSLVILTTW